MLIDRNFTAYGSNGTYIDVGINLQTRDSVTFSVTAPFYAVVAMAPTSSFTAAPLYEVYFYAANQAIVYVYAKLIVSLALFTRIN
jgi:hypothetical protein